MPALNIQTNHDMLLVLWGHQDIFQAQMILTWDKNHLMKYREAFALQAEGLILGGVDALLIETSQDILEVKLVIEACHQCNEKNWKKSTNHFKHNFDQYGKMLLGTNIQAAYTTVSDMGIDVFGLNCSTGPIEMTPSVRWLDEQNEHNLLGGAKCRNA